MYVPIELDTIDLMIAADVLAVLGSDQNGSEVSSQGGMRAVGRKHCKRCHDASAQVKAGGSSRATSTRRRASAVSGHRTSRSNEQTGKRAAMLFGKEALATLALSGSSSN